MKKSYIQLRLRFTPQVMERLRADQIRREREGYPPASLNDTITRLAIEHLAVPTEEESREIRNRYPVSSPKQSPKRSPLRKRPRIEESLATSRPEPIKFRVYGAPRIQGSLASSKPDLIELHRYVMGVA